METLMQKRRLVSCVMYTDWLSDCSCSCCCSEVGELLSDLVNNNFYLDIFR
jgi:hypothetical protein